MSATVAVAPSRRSRARSRAPSIASSLRSDDPFAGAATANGNGRVYSISRPSSPSGYGAGERTVKKLRLSRALTVPDGTTVAEACRRMAARRVDAVLLTDAQGLLSGIVTDKDIATRVIAEGLRAEQTIISKIMTRNPSYVMADSLAIEALQKMVQGKFRHLPVVDNGEVIAMLDITKCLYDAISRLEKAVEQGIALAAVGVDGQVGDNFPAPQALIETLRERMFSPTLSTIITESTKVAIVSPSDPVYVATQKMRELRVNSVVITAGNSLQGIFTSKDVLMRVVAQNLHPELTLVEKVMTEHPDCATLDTAILDALHIMHDGKFSHLPVLDGDGRVIACLDVLQLTHAAISMVEGGPGTASDVANTIMQKFWDSALALEPPEEEFDSHSESSLVMTSPSEIGDGKSNMYPRAVGNSFAFKLQDQKGRIHRFTCGSESLDELVSSATHRLGIGGENGKAQLLYEDDEGDRVLLMTDCDLANAVLYAKSSGLKALRLYIDDSNSNNEVAQPLPEMASAQGNQLTFVHYGLMACAMALTGTVVMVCWKRSKA